MAAPPTPTPTPSLALAPPPPLEQLLAATPRLSRQDLRHLQDWAAKQPHLPHLDEEELVPVLHRCDYSLERSKELLERLLTMRTHAPELFRFRHPDHPAVKAQAHLFHAAVAGPDARGRVVVCTGWAPGADLDAYVPEACAWLALALVALTVRAWPTAPGFVLVMDAEHLCVAHITRPSVALIRKLLAFLQEAVPARIEAVHVIRLNPVVDRLMMLVKPFLSKETQERLHFHSKDLEAFYAAVPRALLPRDFGGPRPHSAEFHGALLSELRASAEWLRARDSLVVVEARRPGRARAEGDVFGVGGSFKRLDFD